MNARSGIPPPMTSAKHKPSSCTSFLPMQFEMDRPLTYPVPEPATKVRRTLADRAGDPVNRKPTAPSSTRPLSTSVKSTVARKERGFSASTSTSRAGSRPASRSATTSTFSASAGTAAKASARPRSAYGQYAGTHVRSKSHHSTARPATSMYRRDEEEDDEEERGLQPFLISTNPGESFKVPRKTRSTHQNRPHSVSIRSEERRVGKERR